MARPEKMGAKRALKGKKKTGRIHRPSNSIKTDNQQFSVIYYNIWNNKT